MNSVHLEPEHQILFRIIWDNKTVSVTNDGVWSVDNCDSWAHEAVWGTRARNNTNDDVLCRDTDMDMVDSDGKCCQLSVQAMCPALNELKHTTWQNPNKFELCDIFTDYCPTYLCWCWRCRAWRSVLLPAAGRGASTPCCWARTPTCPPHSHRAARSQADPLQIIRFIMQFYLLILVLFRFDLNEMG